MQYKTLLSNVLKVTFIPGFHDMDEILARPIDTPEKEVDAVEFLALAFSIVKLIAHDYPKAIASVTEGNWLKKTCENANLVYDKAVADKLGEHEGLYLKIPAGSLRSIQEILDLDSRKTLIPQVLESVKSLIQEIYHLEKVVDEVLAPV